MTDTTRVRLRTSGGFLIESVDVTPMGEGRYRLEEPLAMSSDIAMHDVIETREDIDASDMIAPIVGHVGDGNFHLLILIDPDDQAQLDKAEEINERMVHRAISMGGTCTGEHGVGIGKMDFLLAEHGEAISVMRTLKLAIDPDNIMNPGKILRL